MDDVSHLIDGLNSPRAADRAAAAERLAQTGEAARPAAIGLLRHAGDADETVREWSIAALEALGPPAAEDLDALVEHLEASAADGPSAADGGYWAATLLGRLGSDAGPAVDRLAQAAGSHPQPRVRERAVWALGQIGPAAAAARPVLQQAARSDQPRLARLAERALSQIGRAN